MTAGADHAEQADRSSANGDERIDDSAFRFLIDCNADGILVLDPGGTALFVNPEAVRIFGRPAERLQGAQLGMPLVSGETSEVAIHQPNGHRVDVELRVTDATWRGAPALLASLRDVSQRREMEDRLRQNQKMEAVGRLTAGVAHDFNNLLTVVMGNLELISFRIKDEKGKLRQAVTNAREGAQRAAQLTQQLLAFSRKQPLTPTRVDIRSLIEGMVGLLARTLGAAIRIETEIDDDIWTIRVDPSQLETAIINLAVNARHAMDGSGVLRIAAHNVAATDDGTGDRVLLSVSDNGCGMPEHVRSKVFEPFFTTKGQGEGTGLGLSQVYGFVQQSGGEVEIDSAPDEGTCVNLWLTRSVGDETATPNPGTHASERPRSGLRVLLVEDDDAVRSFARSVLEESGHQVTEAEDGASAHELLAGDEPIDLLFTDLRLPGDRDGSELVAFARRARPHLPALIATAYAGDLLEDGKLPDAVNLLTKPYSADALRGALDRSTGSARVARRVLLVEDDELVRSTIADSLTEAGCKVRCAERAGEAIEVLEDTNDWHLVIVDVDLPDGRGDNMLVDIRALAPNATIVVVTGLLDDSLQERCDALDRVTLLAKPIDFEDLRPLVEAI